MDGEVGDRLIVLGNRVGQPRREGEIVEVMARSGVRHYKVRWSDGNESVMFPGSDVRIEPADEATPLRHSLTIELRLIEDGDRCEATATMMTSAGTFTGTGHARRHPDDPEVPMVGEELATARALHALARSLEGAAEQTMASEEPRPFRLA